MKRAANFDFKQIHSIGDFYREAKSQLDLPSYFGNNLDALYDIITGHLEMPLEITFFNLSPARITAFHDLLATLREAARNTKGFTFTTIIPPSRTYEVE